MKTHFLSLCALLAVCTVAADESKKAAACCAPDADTPKVAAACCQPAADSAPFSRESLYQIETKFTDDAGQSFTLGQLRGRPVVLTMFFASCGYACPLLVTDMQAIRAQLPVAVREKAVFVLVSFDVKRDTPDVLHRYRTDRALDGGWTLLHGDDDAVRELAALLGVKYKQEADGMFSHSNLVTILNAEGEIVHQRSGLRGGLDEVVASLQRQ